MERRFSYQFHEDDEAGQHIFFIVPARAKDRIKDRESQDRYRGMNEAEKWCIENIDPALWRWRSSWSFQFNDEVAATMFRLRWC